MDHQAAGQFWDYLRKNHPLFLETVRDMERMSTPMSEADEARQQQHIEQLSSLHGPLTALLQKFHPLLHVEFDAETEPPVFRVTITCHGHEEGKDAVQDLIAQAPVLEGMEFVAFRLPAQPPQPGEDPFTVELAGEEIDIGEFLFSARASAEQPGKYELSVYRPQDVGPQVSQAELLRAAVAVIDTGLGEYLMLERVADLGEGSTLPVDAMDVWQLRRRLEQSDLQ